MNSKVLALLLVCVASAIGLVSLGIPEPTKAPLTSTQAVTSTGSQSFTVNLPQASAITAVSYPRTEVGGIWLYYTTLCNINYSNQSPTTVCATATTYTTTGDSPFTYINFIVTSLTTTENYSASSEPVPPPAVIISATWATLTYSPEISTSTSATTSSVTSSLIWTSELTKQVAPISTGGMYQAIAIDLVVILALSLLIISRIRNGRIRPLQE
jgi:hypothetical protein